MKQKNKYFLIVCILLNILVLTTDAQAETINSDGNWSDAGSWTGGNIGQAGDAVIMNNGTDIIIQDGESYVIASLNVGKDGSITINVGGSLTVTGSVIVDKTFTINSNGSFTINNNLDVAKDLILNVGEMGTMNILGDVALAKDATLDILGDLEVIGSLTSAQNAVINVGIDGTLDVGEILNLGPGSTVVGDGPVTVDPENCTGAACTDPQLPISLSTFIANISLNQEYVDLHWSTESEENFDFFDIQKSLNGEDYNSIGNEAGNGNSSVKIDYSYRDYNPYFGKSYYRLVAVDYDGTFEIFNAIVVNYIPDQLLMNIYPNPIQDNKFNINFGLPVDSKNKSISIFDLSGTKIKQFYLLDNNETIQPDLAVGIYLVKIQIDNYVLTKRLLVK